MHFRAAVEVGDLRGPPELEALGAEITLAVVAI
jgi:hypothetical protein